MPVDPRLRIGGEECGLELPGRQHHLLIGTVEPIAIHVHVPELVVGPDLLQLSIRGHQRLLIPEPNVVDGRLIGLERVERQVLLDGERFGGDLMKIVGLSGEP